MSERELDRVMDLADQMRDQAAQAEQIGRLTDATVKMMKSAGLIRLLQTKQYQGFEAHPREFAETTMATAALDPAAGWIVGVVGVHPYQLAYADPKVSAEIWADDVDTWMASPYAPQGVARPVDGGFIFNGRWQFSSGTDHCDWIILGAMRGDDKGIPVLPPQMLHMILPRKDYEIVEDSWNVVGLRGTGSKDVIVKDAFVPAYRTMDATKVMDGTAQREAGMTEPLYLMPWSTMFPLGISAATIGIAEGALAAHLDYQRERVGATGTAIKDDPYVMYAVGEAAADMSELKSLGYITISTNDIERWRHFAFGVLGFAEGKGADPSALYLRMDERAARIVVVPGDADRVLTIGWEVRDHAALQRVKATLDGAGVAFKQ